MRKGSNHSNRKLTEEKVLAMRREYKWYRVTHKQLAKKYRVAPCTVGAIIRGHAWKHVDRQVPGYVRK